MARSKAVILVQMQNLVKEFEITDDDIMDEARKLVENKYLAEFISLVDDLDADIEFLAYWEIDANCQKAIEMVFKSRKDRLDKFSGLIGELLGEGI